MANRVLDRLYTICYTINRIWVRRDFGLAPGSEAYESWFRRSFAMLADILEDSWTYQEIVKKGMQQGLEQGRQQLIRELRDTVISLVRMRFPMLLALAESHVE